MQSASLPDHGEWATRFGVSREAAEIHLAGDVIDLHIDTFIWSRAWGYDILRRHGTGAFGARFYGHADLPRLIDAHVTGGVWSITTNFLRRRRAETLQKNMERLRAIFASAADRVVEVRTVAEYRRARQDGKHAAWLGVQGGNALDEPGALDALEPESLIKVTVVHLTTSTLGGTSSPLGGRGEKHGLTDLGREFVRGLDAKRIFVDLAHISPRGFWDAVEVHDKSLPLLVSHTGIAGVYPHWRNVDDAQLRAVADSGGVIGVMYQSSFLGASGVTAETVVDHIDHIVKTVGEDYAALGSDWDGAITPPRDFKSCLELPRLVEIMLKRGYSAERIGKILGRNFLRALSLLRR